MSPAIAGLDTLSTALRGDFCPSPSKKKQICIGIRVVLPSGQTVNRNSNTLLNLE